MKNYFIKYLLYFIIILPSLPLHSSQEREEQLISHVERCIDRASMGLSKLNARVINLPGMSSPKVRHLLNNLCTLPETSYLEIGSWKGSTWVSALYNNKDTLSQAISIDNWSHFGGEDNFKANCTRFLPGVPYKTYSADCFALDIHEVCPIPVNIYFYDGEHTALAQEMAFTYYDEILDDVFIAIVDDWNWDMVQNGTRAAFEKLDYQILYERILPAKWNEEKQNFDMENWWNGLYIAVIKRR